MVVRYPRSHWARIDRQELVAGRPSGMFGTGMTCTEATIRSLTSQADYLACVDLQYETWGKGFADCVPPAVLQISAKVGGVMAGAFDASAKMLGFVFGLAGWKDGERCHWSHMLAVRQEARDRGIGRALKVFQRQELLDRDIDTMYWTYDPLVARNAHLNLQKLGAQVVEYVRDMYGVDQTSITDSIIGSDRFVVRWDLNAGAGGRSTSPRTTKQANADAPLVVAQNEATGNQPATIDWPGDHPVVRVEIPTDIQALKLVMPDVARHWRITTRRVFRSYLGLGYRVAGFHTDAESQRCFYYLVGQPKAGDH